MAARREACHAGLVERGTGCQPQLRLDQVDAPHFLGHRVLDLQTRIGLDEAEGILCRIVDQEFECAQAPVVHGLGHGDC